MPLDAYVDFPVSFSTQKENFQHLDEIAAQYDEAKARAEAEEKAKELENERKRKELEAELAKRKAARRKK